MSLIKKIDLQVKYQILKQITILLGFVELVAFASGLSFSITDRLSVEVLLSGGVLFLSWEIRNNLEYTVGEMLVRLQIQKENEHIFSPLIPR